MGFGKGSKSCQWASLPALKLPQKGSRVVANGEGWPMEETQQGGHG